MIPAPKGSKEAQRPPWRVLRFFPSRRLNSADFSFYWVYHTVCWRNRFAVSSRGGGRAIP